MTTLAPNLAAAPLGSPLAAPFAAPLTTPLRALLDLNLRRFPPDYGDRLSSHLPMALQALHSLGADEARLRRFFDAYTRRFEGMPGPAAAQQAPAEWLCLRGDVAAFDALRAYFERALAEQGRDALLRRVLPELLPGVAAVAFHGAIRLAHALESAHQGELAAALGYWASRWQQVPAPPRQSEGKRLTLAAWSERLVTGAGAWRSEAPLIFLRMMDASARPLYAELAGGALPPAASLQARIKEFAGLALGYYLHSGNFTVLHMITGLRALRVLLPWLPAAPAFQVQAQQILTQAFVAAYMAGRVQWREAPPSPNASPSSWGWAELADAATRADDDHAIKLVHACREEWLAYGDARYLQAAAMVCRGAMLR